ncbi:saccharopine dehydrogenase [Prolixibacteraceae bacterium JC049]|nr:saccharopine dehydrogenase [Prolixibacteraceae bacterium JC049]
MKTIIIFGAGRSANSLIQYLEKNAFVYDWEIKVVDKNADLFAHKTSERMTGVTLDIFDAEQRGKLVKDADLVISMLPARFHHLVVEDCLKYEKSLFTASYESKKAHEYANEVKDKGLLFLNEMGLDPGLDHMSAMKIINEIRGKGHKLTGFESFTGGLVAPESDNNPWGYKFSWNPRNVVVAGQDGPARFIQRGKYKYIPYNRLFRRTEKIEIDGYGRFEGYANRDSLKYIDRYGLEGIETIYRGTLRRPGFCKAWNIFVQLGATDDSYIMEDTENMTHADFINSFLYYNELNTVRLKLYHYMHLDQDSDILEKLEWLGIFDDTPVGLTNATPAQILQHILMKKWKLEPNDKDMIAMWHRFDYLDAESGEPEIATASLVVEGDDSEYTAMAKTVGLPLAIAAKLYLTGQLDMRGVLIPTIPEIYEPILNELEENGIEFKEKILTEK